MGRGGGGGLHRHILLFAFLFYIAVVSQGDAAGANKRWYAASPLRGFRGSRIRRSANSRGGSHYLKRQGLYGRGRQQFQRVMRSGGGDGSVLSDANLELATNGGILRICGRRGLCYDSRLVDPVKAWEESPRPMPWIPLDNYDANVANIASNFFHDRRRYVYPWSSHPFI